MGENFKYANKEFESDLGKNTVSFEWRDYDPAIGRFNKMDRYADKYYSLTPYHYTANNPLNFIDKAGDSLTLTYGNRTITYSEGNYFENGKQLELNKNGKITGKGRSFFNQIKSNISELESTEGGNNLVDYLANGTDKIVDIKYSNSPGRSNAIPSSTGEFNNPDLAHNATYFERQELGGLPFVNGDPTEIGSNVTIHFDPNNLGGFNTTAGFKNVSSTRKIGHELFHAAEGTLGIMSWSNPNIRESRAIHFMNSIMSGPKRINSSDRENSQRSLLPVSSTPSYISGQNNIINNVLLKGL